MLILTCPGPGNRVTALCQVSVHIPHACLAQRISDPEEGSALGTDQAVRLGRMAIRKMKRMAGKMLVNHGENDILKHLKSSKII